MSSIKNITQWLTAILSVKSERGASMVEYGILVAAIAVVVIGLVFTLGGLLGDSFTEVNSELSSNLTP